MAREALIDNNIIGIVRLSTETYQLISVVEISPLLSLSISQPKPRQYTETGLQFPLYFLL